MQSADVRATVKKRYGEVAMSVIGGNRASCCGTSATSCCASDGVSIGSLLASGDYSAEETISLPGDAILASLGCGNPTALAELAPGQVVLDLGSGGGIDVLLSARRVGPEGFVYGLDMTDEMLELAERNRSTAGAENVKFLKGEIEDIPLPDNSIDVIISNCVINLSSDKPRVLREAFRVLRPGGLFAVSDIVIQGELPAEIRANMDAWVGCVAGAMEEAEYVGRLVAAGFVDARIEVTNVHDTDDASGCCGALAGEGRVVSGFVRAWKPA
ncbi:MAG TPA: arsenite methyltransferase [Thermomicrobiales bacterium]|jgi:SAM-dependent methyltransferase|nr:arsenite S-adenosylmethyltransferase [Chloroflexota bacterium]HCG28979.1 arsenite S-adenosylmethyltransferase [Chloroflexota bacterium]HQZ91030.1 arsenite methyltransferase [Thermomicrobiales bacterium]